MAARGHDHEGGMDARTLLKHLGGSSDADPRFEPPLPHSQTRGLRVEPPSGCRHEPWSALRIESLHGLVDDMNEAEIFVAQLRQGSRAPRRYGARFREVRTAENCHGD